MYRQKIYIVKEARELLFDGYEDKLITLARRVTKRFKQIKLEVPYDRFGWLYGVS